jgi:type IV pilus assembly protein PilB
VPEADPIAEAIPETSAELFGDLLVRRRTVDAEAVTRALSRQSKGDRRRIGELLVDAGVLSELDLATVLADRHGLTATDLSAVVPEADAAALLGESLVRSLAAMPVRITPEGVDVAVAEPREGLAHELESAIGRPVHLLVGPASQVRTLIDASYRAIGQVRTLVDDLEHDLHRRPGRDIGAEANLLTDDAPVVRVVNLLLTQALRDRASDVHIEPQDGRVRVRFRIDGALHETIELPESLGPALASRLKILARLDIVERRRPQDGQLSLVIDGRTVDMRVSLVATIWGEKCVIRILDTNRSALRLDQLGMPTGAHAAFSKLIHAPFGMVLCAGPTGSGKTTTLYAALGELNETGRNITTVEDPVEYVFDGINQIQVHEQSGVSFATGLRSILRQDPDVILVGEVRDSETARIAVQSALTGHLVLSTLHGTDAVGALHRLLDMGIESFLVASSIAAIIGQRLVRRICPSCAAPYKPSDEELAFFAESGGNPRRKFVHGVGCHLCSGTGFRDRIGVYELLLVTPEIKQLLVGWASQEELRSMAQSQGMRTLRQEAIALVEQNVTTLAEVVRTIHAL